MRKILIICFVGIVSGCIDPIRLEIEDGFGALVVDGLVTDQPGPYTVRLSRSINFDNSRPLRVYANPEKGAKVQIVDNTGAAETLVERSGGVYETISMQGKVGRSYQVLIQTSNGSKYVSSPELMTAAPGVERLEQEFAVYDRLLINKNGVPRVVKMEGFYVYAIANDPADADNYYRWQTDAIFEYFAVNLNPDINHCWAPLTRLEDRIIIADDLYFSGQTFKQFICIVPYERPTKFLVKLRQQSLSEGAYRFWKRTSDQQVSSGSLFDPPPSAINGNVVNEANADETVIGYFGASSVVKFDFLIDRIRASGFQAPYPEKPALSGDCRLHEPGGTTIRPAGFPE